MLSILFTSSPGTKVMQLKYIGRGYKSMGRANNIGRVLRL
jgi:hypothetical protein